MVSFRTTAFLIAGAALACSARVVRRQTEVFDIDAITREPGQAQVALATARNFCRLGNDEATMKSIVQVAEGAVSHFGNEEAKGINLGDDVQQFTARCQGGRAGVVLNVCKDVLFKINDLRSEDDAAEAALRNINTFSREIDNNCPKADPNRFTEF